MVSVNVRENGKKVEDTEKVTKKIDNCNFIQYQKTEFPAKIFVISEFNES
jgi:hypothetical protein